MSHKYEIFYTVASVLTVEAENSREAEKKLKEQLETNYPEAVQITTRWNGRYHD